MMSIPSTKMFAALLGRRIVGLRKLYVPGYHLSKALEVLGTFVIVLDKGDVVLLSIRQSDLDARFLGSEEEARLLVEQEDDDDEYVQCIPMDTREFSVGSVTEVWVRVESEMPFLADVILWDADGEPRLHLICDSDEIHVFPIDVFPNTIHQRSADPFYGVIAQLRYRTLLN